MSVRIVWVLESAAVLGSGKHHASFQVFYITRWRCAYMGPTCEGPYYSTFIPNSYKHPASRWYLQTLPSQGAKPSLVVQCGAKTNCRASVA